MEVLFFWKDLIVIEASSYCTTKLLKYNSID